MSRTVWMLAAIGVALVAVLAGEMASRAQTPAAGPAAATQAAGELAVVGSFAGGGEGGWDYLLVDPDARRVYVARSTRVMVFDADKGTLVGELADTPGVHGLAIVTGRNEGYATCGKDDTLRVFDAKTLKPIRKVKTGKRPDAILYDEASKKVFSFNHAGGDVTVVDPAAPDKEPVTIQVGGTLEFGVADGAGRVYVNVEDKSEVAVIDAKELKVVAHWPVAPGAAPTGLAIDPAKKRLFVGCSNQKMVIIDTALGKVLGDVPVGAGVDGVAFDAQLGLAMTSNGKDGTLTAVREGPDGKFTVVQTLKTAKGARTITDDPKTHRALLPCSLPAGDGAGKFGLLVVGAAKEK